MNLMQSYDDTLQDEKATSLIFIDKIFGMTCKFEGTADDKKGAKIWMKDVVGKISGNVTEDPFKPVSNKTVESESNSNGTAEVQEEES